MPIVTLRRYAPVTRTEAEAEMGRVAAALRGAGLELGELQKEYCILDLNPALDAGWLYPVGGPKTSLLLEIPVS